MDSREQVIFVGGGLANGLAAYRLYKTRPEVPFLMVEQDLRLGGDHTWSCHGADLRPEAREWIAPILSHEWPRHEVRFPSLKRVFDSPYLSIRSREFHAHLMATFGDRVRLGAKVTSITANTVTLATGECFHGGLVIDGRGLDPAKPWRGVGYQKFRGLFVATAAPHAIAHPIVMDATVSQEGGYRFLYVLPWSDTELLVEDTYYDESSSLPGPEKDPAIGAYLESLGITKFTVVGVENGILPIPLHGARLPSRENSGALLSGLAAGLFHPTTGYSLPDAVRFADWLSTQSALTNVALAKAADLRAKAHWRRGAFYRRLNNMLFKATAPEKRFEILATFHQHDAALISRFYAGALHGLDPLRILRRKPPIKLTTAMRAFFSRVAYDT